MVDLQLTPEQIQLVKDTIQGVTVIIMASGLIGFATVKLIKFVTNKF